MPISPFIAAINQIADEKGLPKEVVIDAVEAAIAAAYRKDYADPNDNIRAELTEDSEDVAISQVVTVVADDAVENERAQIALSEAKKGNQKAAVGDEIVAPLETQTDFGRIAAQTAKQVIIQRIREAERDILFTEFKDKEHKVVTGSVQQLEGETVLVNLGKITAIMLPGDQIRVEHYYVGQRLKVFVGGVEETPRGPRVLVSRTHPELVAQLFEQEVPEIQTGSVEIRAISREAGSRTKMAVAATSPGIDPVGSCVGGRGTRVHAVLAELGGEKIDIVMYGDDPITFITNALSPAKVNTVELFVDRQKALVSVDEDQLSLAIGRAGQNVRLASRLTGWSIDIAQTGQEDEKRAAIEAIEPIKKEQKDETTRAKSDSEPKDKTADSAEATPSSLKAAVQKSTRSAKTAKTKAAKSYSKTKPTKTPAKSHQAKSKTTKTS